MIANTNYNIYTRCNIEYCNRKVLKKYPYCKKHINRTIFEAILEKTMVTKFAYKQRHRWKGENREEVKK